MLHMIHAVCLLCCAVVAEDQGAEEANDDIAASLSRFRATKMQIHPLLSELAATLSVSTPDKRVYTCLSTEFELSLAMEANPDPFADHNRRGIAAAQAGDFHVAAAYFTVATGFKPFRRDVWANLGASLTDMVDRNLVTDCQILPALTEAWAASTLSHWLSGDLEQNDGLRRSDRALRSRFDEQRVNTQIGARLLTALEAMALVRQGGHFHAARLLCSSEEDVAVHVSEHERLRGVFSARSALHFFVLMRVCGVAAVRQLLPLQTVEKLAAQQRADLDADEHKIVKAQALSSTGSSSSSSGSSSSSSSGGGGGSSSGGSSSTTSSSTTTTTSTSSSTTTTTSSSTSFEDDTVASRSQGRYEVKLELKEPYTSSELVAHPLLQQLNRLLLDDTIEIDTFSHVTSLPGAKAQHWHSDVNPLFANSAQAQAQAKAATSATAAAAATAAALAAEEGTVTPTAHARPSLHPLRDLPSVDLPSVDLPSAQHLAPQGLVAVVPLVPVNGSNGPTEFFVGSHVRPSQLRQYLQGRRQRLVLQRRVLAAALPPEEDAGKGEDVGGDVGTGESVGGGGDGGGTDQGMGVRAVHAAQLRSLDAQLAIVHEGLVQLATQGGEEAVPTSVPTAGLLRGGTDHFWEEHQYDPPALLPTPQLAVTTQLGDALMFDLRLRHRGLANPSAERRPILYMAFAFAWYQDAVNFKVQQSSEWDQLPSWTERKLLSRLDARAYIASLEAKVGELLRERQDSRQGSWQDMLHTKREGEREIGAADTLRAMKTKLKYKRGQLGCTGECTGYQ
jgi:ectoine hydroxylase-related dioxygenase (phytanoyl-CoA dioxygenase family)